MFSKKDIIKVSKANTIERAIKSNSFKNLQTDIDLQKKIIVVNPKFIRYIDNPCEEIQLFAFKKYKRIYNYIDSPCEEIQLYMINHLKALHSILNKIDDNLTANAQITLIKKFPDAIQELNKIQSETEQFLIDNYKTYYKSFRFLSNIKSLPRHIKLYMLYNDPHFIDIFGDMDDIPKKLQLHIVKGRHNGYIGYIQNPHIDAVKLSLSQNPMCIEYLSYVDNNICQFALDNCSYHGQLDHVIKYCDIEKYPELYEYYVIKYTSM